MADSRQSGEISAALADVDRASKTNPFSLANRDGRRLAAAAAAMGGLGGVLIPTGALAATPPPVHPTGQDLAPAAEPDTHLKTVPQAHFQPWPSPQSLTADLAAVLAWHGDSVRSDLDEELMACAVRVHQTFEQAYAQLVASTTPSTEGDSNETVNADASWETRMREAMAQMPDYATPFQPDPQLTDMPSLRQKHQIAVAECTQAIADFVLEWKPVAPRLSPDALERFLSHWDRRLRERVDDVPTYMPQSDGTALLRPTTCAHLVVTFSMAFMAHRGLASMVSAPSEVTAFAKKSESHEPLSDSPSDVALVLALREALPALYTHVYRVSNLQWHMATLPRRAREAWIFHNHLEVDDPDGPLPLLRPFQLRRMGLPEPEGYSIPVPPQRPVPPFLLAKQGPPFPGMWFVPAPPDPRWFGKAMPRFATNPETGELREWLVPPPPPPPSSSPIALASTSASRHVERPIEMPYRPVRIVVVTAARSSPQTMLRRAQPARQYMALEEKARTANSDGDSSQDDLVRGSEDDSDGRRDIDTENGGGKAGDERSDNKRNNGDASWSDSRATRLIHGKVSSGSSRQRSDASATQPFAYAAILVFFINAAITSLFILIFEWRTASIGRGAHQWFGDAFSVGRAGTRDNVGGRGDGQV
ncbi:hypothetical protein CXG81DRAFT_18652 [Caulochytrium protostelioides]|uniref:Uncharacterized protein n=1 Tax=Caulochytrium protostelioides TaxID=1555241 RepID=A0A4P9X8Z7_9FUNG|nr:hypothetical protein CXG81DRAFT_18652 [Caulochytrium protostelioides]|eukprot:RKP01540.1 hypothetical protein CXG81DRAFT_18652 [Caulochytrium protostelioides]